MDTHHTLSPRLRCIVRTTSFSLCSFLIRRRKYGSKMPLSTATFRGKDLTTLEAHMHDIQEQHIRTRKEAFPLQLEPPSKCTTNSTKASVSVQVNVEQISKEDVDTPTPSVLIPVDGAGNDGPPMVCRAKYVYTINFVSYRSDFT